MTKTSNMLLVVFTLASLAMFCCAVADVWKSDPDGAQGRESANASLFRSDWFFYFNALLSFVSMFGLSMLT